MDNTDSEEDEVFITLKVGIFFSLKPVNSPLNFA
jgi:hypothetical protein